MQTLEKILKACAGGNRIRILRILQKKKMCVCEIAYVLGITQPSVSRHLKKLKDAGLIESEQDGFWTNYYLKPGSEYQKVLLSHIKEWMNSDEVIKKDLEKMETADRKKLCCK